MRFRLVKLSLFSALMLLLAIASAPVPSRADEAPVKTPEDAAGNEFFEKKVRPVLVQQCYGCHSLSAKKTMGGLALDSRSALMKGGQTGPALVPGHPDTSRLMDAVRYAKPDLQMPPKAKLPDSVIADMTEWIKMGAPWPETLWQKTGETGGALTALEMRKRQHWAFQPVRKVSAACGESENRRSQSH